MSTRERTLEELINELPPQSKDEVKLFVESLLEKQKQEGGVAGATHKLSFEDLFGSWDGGDPHSADNERIDADLAREYADTHEAEK